MSTATIAAAQGRTVVTLESILDALDISQQTPPWGTRLGDTIVSIDDTMISTGWIGHTYTDERGVGIEYRREPANHPAASPQEPQAPAPTASPPTQKTPTATEILSEAAKCIGERAATRDLPAERSMARTVTAFNALAGHRLSERDGWLFMAILKAARATAGSHNPDDYLDGAAYFALAGESAEA
jgi:hypothetical protein